MPEMILLLKNVSAVFLHHSDLFLKNVSKAIHVVLLSWNPHTHFLHSWGFTPLCVYLSPSFSISPSIPPSIPPPLLLPLPIPQSLFPSPLNTSPLNTSPLNTSRLIPYFSTSLFLPPSFHQTLLYRSLSFLPHFPHSPSLSFFSSPSLHQSYSTLSPSLYLSLLLSLSPLSSSHPLSPLPFLSRLTAWARTLHARAPSSASLTSSRCSS